MKTKLFLCNICLITLSKIIAPFILRLEYSAPTLQDIVSFINLNNRIDVSRLNSISNE